MALKVERVSGDVVRIKSDEYVDVHIEVSRLRESVGR